MMERIARGRNLSLDAGFGRLGLQAGLQAEYGLRVEGQTAVTISSQSGLPLSDDVEARHCPDFFPHSEQYPGQFDAYQLLAPDEKRQSHRPPEARSDRPRIWGTASFSSSS
jgi:hypothetical protein